MKKILGLVLCLFLFSANLSQAQEPVVYGVFFYSPTCHHCHEVMDNHWPSIAARFGNQLQVVFVDVSTAAGRAFMETAIWSLNLQSNGVPQLIIGDEVMVGSVEIPQRAPRVIQAGLEAGGVPYPAIPNVESWFNGAGIAAPTLATLNPLMNLNADPANTLAILVLVLGLFNLGLVTWAAWQALAQNQNHLLIRINHALGWWVLLLGILLAFAVALSLLFGSTDSLVFGLALLLLAVLSLMLFLMNRKSNLEELPAVLIPLLLLVGFIVSGYLSYVEMSLTAPVCGAWGNCLAVQQSAYAKIGGVPMSFIGLCAYSMLFVIYVARRFLGASAELLLLVFTSFGLVFSLYLSFLEPFVIGATCAWCLLSAIVMLSVFWLIVPECIGKFLNRTKW